MLTIHKQAENMNKPQNINAPIHQPQSKNSNDKCRCVSFKSNTPISKDANSNIKSHQQHEPMPLHHQGA
jgi:hypothetical protein